MSGRVDELRDAVMRMAVRLGQTELWHGFAMRNDGIGSSEARRGERSRERQLASIRRLTLALATAASDGTPDDAPPAAPCPVDSDIAATGCDIDADDALTPEQVVEHRRHGQLLYDIWCLAYDGHPGDPFECLDRIRELIAEYDRHATPGGSGRRNVSTDAGTPLMGADQGLSQRLRQQDERSVGASSWVPTAATKGVHTVDPLPAAEPVKPWWPGTDWKAGCPAWCVEHYRGTDGSYQHSSFPWSITGESANREDVPVLVSAWIEMRVHADGDRHAVGVIEKVREDVELSHCQLRSLAKHLLDIAQLVEEIEGAAS